MLAVGESGVKAAGLVDRVLDTPRVADIEALAFTEVHSDAAVHSVTQGIALARDKSCDLIVGVGGGAHSTQPRRLARCLATRAQFATMSA
ncbi:hypothetical protein AX768_11940 [Burkholderia sp. PAMC 28687]|nr:hypothetical protein AX768_11940 [Burkholderia sp. PAMC 28687]